MIEFLLNLEPVQLDDVAPNLSVLDWLRTKKGLSGTKEGCASGDCGACTVAIGTKTDSGMQYQSINACLLLVGNLHGKHLITVEALSNSAATSVEQLHPVQRALVECHGSQCGFCTPGFVMSMFVLYTNHRDYPGEAKVIEQLGGNLCRCTGYRPIIEACQHMYEFPRSTDRFSAAVMQFNKQTLIANPGLSHGEQQFFLPQSIAACLALKDQYPAARLIAGGTDLSLEFTQALTEAEVIISLTQVSELQSIRDDNSGMSIGAAAAYADVVPAFCEQYPEAAEMFHRLGSAQIRNAGTIGGSLGNASPIGDPAPLLLALNATVLVASVEGERTIPLQEFFLAYRKTALASNEIIVSIQIPTRPDNLTLACYKISKRIEDDISTVLLAVAFVNENGRMRSVKTGFGGMAATPLSVSEFESFLENKIFSEQTMTEASDVLTTLLNPMTDVRATREYRLNACKNLLQRLWLEQSSSTLTRVSHAAL